MNKNIIFKILYSKLFLYKTIYYMLYVTARHLVVFGVEDVEGEFRFISYIYMHHNFFTQSNGKSVCFTRKLAKSLKDYIEIYN